ncbi:MAG: hypothetical protein R3F43_12990 [bacterium]
MPGLAGPAIWRPAAEGTCGAFAPGSAGTVGGMYLARARVRLPGRGVAALHVAVGGAARVFWAGRLVGVVADGRRCSSPRGGALPLLIEVRTALGVEPRLALRWTTPDGAPRRPARRPGRWPRHAAVRAHRTATPGAAGPGSGAGRRPGPGGPRPDGAPGGAATPARPAAGAPRRASRARAGRRPGGGSPPDRPGDGPGPADGPPAHPGARRRRGGRAPARPHQNGGPPRARAGVANGGLGGPGGVR